jgi:hypothetical protein
MFFAITSAASSAGVLVHVRPGGSDFRRCVIVFGWHISWTGEGVTTARQAPLFVDVVVVQ